MSTLQPTHKKSLRNTDSFTEQTMQKLSEIMYEHKIQAGSHLFWEGDRADKLYYVKRGRVKITKSNDEGKMFILYMYGEGDMFGQLDPFQNSTNRFNAEVIEETTVGIIQQKDLEVLLWQHGDLAIEFMKWMGLMHRMTETKFRDIMMFGKPGALCSTLIRLCNTYGQPLGTQTVITKKLTNSDLADMIGATRESVNRMLGELKKSDVIAIENQYIIVKNIGFLRDTCRCENCPIDVCRV